MVERLRRRIPRLVRSVSVTTRAPRTGERRGRDYRFISVAAFRRLKRSGQLLEWAKVHGACYGTLKRPIAQALAHGKNAVLSIDVQGARQVRRALRKHAVLIFLLPPSMARLRQRLLRRRTETPSVIRRRLQAARREIACASWYDHRVVNDRLGRTVRAVEQIMTAERAVHIKGRSRLTARRA